MVESVFDVMYIQFACAFLPIHMATSSSRRGATIPVLVRAGSGSGSGSGSGAGASAAATIKWKEAQVDPALFGAMQCYMSITTTGSDAIALFGAPISSSTTPMHLGDAPFPFNMGLYPDTDLYLVGVGDGAGAKPRALSPTAIPTIAFGLPNHVGGSSDAASPPGPFRGLPLAEWKSTVLPWLQTLDSTACIEHSLGSRQWAVATGHAGGSGDGEGDGDGDSEEDAAPGVASGHGPGPGPFTGQPFDLDLDLDDDAIMDTVDKGIVASAPAGLKKAGGVAAPGSVSGGFLDEEDDDEEEDAEGEGDADGAEEVDEVVVDARTGLVVDKLGYDVGNEDEMESIEGSEQEEDSEGEDEEAEDEDAGGAGAED